MTNTTSRQLPVRLIALDLDDTLLDSKAEISDENVRALQRAAALGIYIVLCSGRAEAAILPFVRRLNLAGTQAGRFIIAINGCTVFDMHKRERIFQRIVQPEILRLANAEAEKMGFCSEVYTPDTIYYRQKTEWTSLDVDLCGLKGEAVADFDEFLKRGFAKMLIPGEPKDLLILQERLKEKLKDKAVVFISKPYFLEVLPPACGKGEAVTFLADRLGIPVAQTMGFGDSMNDESMIRLCGYGVAMKNALPYIQQIADFVTQKDNDSSGVGDFINRHIL